MPRTRSRTRSREDRRKSSGNPYAPAKGVEALGVGGSCIALGIVLPFFLHPLGISPRVFLPMHFPVFLAGMLLTPAMAAAVGALTPALSMGFTGMPSADQALRMIPELVAYAVATSVILRAMPKWPVFSERTARIASLVTAMVVAMIAGRLVYVMISTAMIGLQSLHSYLLLLVFPAIPGIVIQLVLVPPLAYRVQQVIYRSESSN